MFAGYATIVVNTDKEKVVTLLGIAIMWGLVVIVVVHSVSHINPAMMIAFSIGT